MNKEQSPKLDPLQKIGLTIFYGAIFAAILDAALPSHPISSAMLPSHQKQEEAK